MCATKRNNFGSFFTYSFLIFITFFFNLCLSCLLTILPFTGWFYSLKITFEMDFWLLWLGSLKKLTQSVRKYMLWNNAVCHVSGFLLIPSRSSKHLLPMKLSKSLSIYWELHGNLKYDVRRLEHFVAEILEICSA